MTLTEFLLARIAEDEARMDDALWYTRPDGSRIRPRIDDEPVERSKARIFRREMAECEAKRRIVLLAGDAEAHTSTGLPKDYMRATMRALAAVYSDHPDYDEAWRP